MPHDYAQVSVDDNDMVATQWMQSSTGTEPASSLVHGTSSSHPPYTSNWTEISSDNNNDNDNDSPPFPSSQQQGPSIHPSRMSPTARVLARLTNPLKSIAASVTSRTSRFTSNSTTASTAAYSPLREREGRASSRHSNLGHSSTVIGGIHNPEGSSSSSSSSGPSSSSSSSRVMMPRPAVDGVFANLSAKPELESQKDNEQSPPTYESAVQDVTPPYYELTVMSPSVFDDETLVHGMPVGNFFQFLWNAAVAVSFQFIGVLLTYLLHNSHASKCGSMTGLGITLINFGIQMRGGLGAMLGYDTTEPGTGHAGEVTKPGAGGGSYMDDTGYIGGSDQYDDGSSVQDIDWLQSDIESHWVSLLLMIAGWLVIIKALAEYAYAKRTELVISARPADERAASARELREFMNGEI
ncbi:hypothetical protein BGZ93_008556 [Podila epicladia]|nr:hypothetical protein BGZ92_001491 [Podila epicladia]KAG0091964.1 hypothetical protein BGZ93_008556 [Podila epicladia]